MMKDAQRPTRAETPPGELRRGLREARGWRGPARRKFATRKGLPPVHILRYIDTLFPLTANRGPAIIQTV